MTKGLIASLVLLMLTVSDAWADPLEDFVLLDAIAQSRAETAAAAQELQDRELEMHSKIFQGELALQRCGDCPEKDKIKTELDEWKNRQKTFEQVAWNVLEKFQTPEGLRGWAVVLGLATPEEFYDKNKIPLGQVVNKMRNEGVPERCIDYYKDYDACSKNYAIDAHGRGPCREQFKIFRACEAGDEATITELTAKMSLRVRGMPVPDVRLTDSYDEIFFGEVPATFTPKVPPPSLMGKAHTLNLVMVKKKPGALTNIRLRKYSEQFFDERNASGMPGERRRELRSVFEQLKNKDVYVLECFYVGSQYAYPFGGGESFVYWWDHKPVLDPDLAKRVEAIPVTAAFAKPIRSASTTCPPTASQ